MTPAPRPLWALLALITAAVALASLVLTPWLELEPCHLCILQRTPVHADGAAGGTDRRAVVLILVGLAGQTRADSSDTTTPPRSTPMNDIPFADYLRRFDYDERVAMKI